MLLSSWAQSSTQNSCLVAMLRRAQIINETHTTELTIKIVNYTNPRSRAAGGGRIRPHPGGIRGRRTSKAISATDTHSRYKMRRRAKSPNVCDTQLINYTLAADWHGSRRVRTTSSHSPWTSCSLSHPPVWSLLLMLYQTDDGLLSCPRHTWPV